MSRVSHRVENPDGDVRQRLQNFVSQNCARLPYDGVRWEDPAWDISSGEANPRAHLAHRRNVIFSEHAGSRVPIGKRVLFERCFADFIKACLVHRAINKSVHSGPQKLLVRASRYLYNNLPPRVRRDVTMLNAGHFIAAEASCLNSEQKNSAYTVLVLLQIIAEIVDRHALSSSRISYRSSAVKPLEYKDRTSATFEQRTAKLPSSELLDALAMIANDPRLKEQPFDLLRMRITEINLVGGFRIGELLTLPENTLVRRVTLDITGIVREGTSIGAPIESLALRYFPEKGGEPILKDVPTVAIPLFERAFDDIERLCGPARENALWLEAHPGEVNLDIPDDERVPAHRLAQILGIEGTANVREWFSERGRGGPAMVVGIGASAYVLGKDQRKGLASERFDRPVLVRDDGQAQSLGESLLVRFFRQWSANRPTNWFISEPITWLHMSDFLCGREGAPSIFERLGYVDQDGKPFRVTTHSFRHFVNTILLRGGLSVIEVTRFMGRRNIADSASYDHRTAAELAGDVRDLIIKNEVYGTVAEQTRALPEIERRRFLESRLAMLHQTPLGNCGSNVAENPCYTAVSCLAGCRHYLRVKGDRASRESLLQIEASIIVALQKARDAEARGEHNAESWIHAHETVLRTTRAALAIDEDASIEIGVARQVNPKGPMMGKPL